MTRTNTNEMVAARTVERSVPPSDGGPRRWASDRSNQSAWGPIEASLLVVTFFGVVCYLIIRDQGVLTGLAIIVFAPVAMISGPLVLATRRRADAVAVTVWALAGFVAVQVFSWWGFVIAALVGILSRRSRARNLQRT